MLQRWLTAPIELPPSKRPDLAGRDVRFVATRLLNVILRWHTPSPRGSVGGGKCRQHPAADELADEIQDAVRRWWQIIDRAPDRMYAGPCSAVIEGVECTEQLYANSKRATVSCRTCGSVWWLWDRRPSTGGLHAHCPALAMQLLGMPRADNERQMRSAHPETVGNEEPASTTGQARPQGHRLQASPPAIGTPMQGMRDGCGRGRPHPAVEPRRRDVRPRQRAITVRRAPRRQNAG